MQLLKKYLIDFLVVAFASLQLLLQNDKVSFLSAFSFYLILIIILEINIIYNYLSS